MTGKLKHRDSVKEGKPELRNGPPHFSCPTVGMVQLSSLGERSIVLFSTITIIKQTPSYVMLSEKLKFTRLLLSRRKLVIYEFKEQRNV
jgi:hypothetical protein